VGYNRFYLPRGREGSGVRMGSNEVGDEAGEAGAGVSVGLSTGVEDLVRGRRGGSVVSVGRVFATGSSGWCSRRDRVFAAGSVGVLTGE
jgi:hypothetical protein